MGRKLSDYMAGREDGLKPALDIVKQGGIEALEKEIHFRNITGIHTHLAKKELEKATKKIKEMTIDTFTVLAVAAVRDEFGFGQKRCLRLVENMNRKAECLMGDMVSWKEMTETIKEELGIELTIRRND